MKKIEALVLAGLISLVSCKEQKNKPVFIPSQIDTSQNSSLFSPTEFIKKADTIDWEYNKSEMDSFQELGLGSSYIETLQNALPQDIQHISPGDITPYSDKTKLEGSSGNYKITKKYAFQENIKIVIIEHYGSDNKIIYKEEKFLNKKNNEKAILNWVYFNDLERISNIFIRDNKNNLISKIEYGGNSQEWDYSFVRNNSGMDFEKGISLTEKLKE